MTETNRSDAALPKRRAASGPQFGFWADPRTVLSLLAAWLALTLFFNGFPALDEAAARYFFAAGKCADANAAAVCGVFPLAQEASWQAMRRFLNDLPAWIVVAVAIMLIRDALMGYRWSDMRVRFLAVALAAFVVGPGLLVNGLFKTFWGRPRPVATDLFGGALPFVPAGQWSSECHHNCSFVSGEASTAFWLICLVPLFPRHLRPWALAAAIFIAVLTGGLRIAFGGHYLSDVALGGLSTLVVFAALAWACERFLKPAPPDEGRSCPPALSC